MRILIYILPALAVAGIVYFAISRKSSPLVRRAAVIALILAGVSLAVCSVFALIQPAAGPGFSPAAPPPDTPVKPAVAADWRLLIALAAAALIFIIIIAVAARRERRRTEARAASPARW
jgi:hypothetical protein